MSFDIMQFVREQKQEFDRTVACKHTPFDDLYPYMVEHSSFFWYKRHASWSSLLTALRIAEAAGAKWQELFTPDQMLMIKCRVLDKKVLDHWLETSDAENDVTVE